MRIIIRYRQRSSRAWAGSGWSKVATQLALRMSRGAIRSGALPTAALPNGELPRKHRFPSITLGQHQLNFSARWATQPPAKACAFERRSDTGKARTVFDALSLQQRQCKGAMEDVTGRQCVYDRHDWRLHVTDGALIKPEVAQFAAARTDMATRVRQLTAPCRQNFQ